MFSGVWTKNKNTIPKTIKNLTLSVINIAKHVPNVSGDPLHPPAVWCKNQPAAPPAQQVAVPWWHETVLIRRNISVALGVFFIFPCRLKVTYMPSTCSRKKNCAFWEAIDSFYNQFINICANWPLRLRMFQSCLLLVNTQKKNTTSPPSNLLTLFPSHLRYCAQCALYLLLLFHASYITAFSSINAFWEAPVGKRLDDSWAGRLANKFFGH